MDHFKPYFIGLRTVFVLGILLILPITGSTQTDDPPPSECGDGVCDADEVDSCPEDCDGVRDEERSYILKNHPDGNQAPPEYCLRLDNFLADQPGVFSCDCNKAATGLDRDIALVVDLSGSQNDAGTFTGSISISGDALCGLHDGTGGRDPAFTQGYHIEMDYPDAQITVNDDESITVVVPDSEDIFGTFTELAGEMRSFDLKGKGDSNGNAAILDFGHRLDDPTIQTWRGWLNTGQPGTHDWLAIAEPTDGQEPPSCEEQLDALPGEKNPNCAGKTILESLADIEAYNQSGSGVTNAVLRSINFGGDTASIDAGGCNVTVAKHAILSHVGDFTVENAHKARVLGRIEAEDNLSTINIASSIAVIGKLGAITSDNTGIAAGKVVVRNELSDLSAATGATSVHTICARRFKAAHESQLSGGTFNLTTVKNAVLRGSTFTYDDMNFDVGRNLRIHDNAQVDVTNTFLANVANNIKGTDWTAIAGSVDFTAGRDIILEGTGSITTTSPNSTRINSNRNVILAQAQNFKSMTVLANSLTRLSTGLRINSADDDPAGLLLESERIEVTGVVAENLGDLTLKATEALAVTDSEFRVERANAESGGSLTWIGGEITGPDRNGDGIPDELGERVSMIAIADGAVSTINDILVRMKTLATQAGSGQLAGEERATVNNLTAVVENANLSSTGTLDVIASNIANVNGNGELKLSAGVLSNIERSEVRGMEVVLVLDNTGSMSGSKIESSTIEADILDILVGSSVNILESNLVVQSRANIAGSNVQVGGPGGQQDVLEGPSYTITAAAGDVLIEDAQIAVPAYTVNAPAGAVIQNNVNLLAESIVLNASGVLELIDMDMEDVRDVTVTADRIRQERTTATTDNYTASSVGDTDYIAVNLTILESANITVGGVQTIDEASVISILGECVEVFEGNSFCEAGGASEICDDGVDNDGDNLIDCRDPDCFNDPACLARQEDCSDGVDNDNDCLIDCCDRDDCANDAFCIGREILCITPTEICDDGIDNECDGAIDCQDIDCANAPNCV